MTAYADVDAILSGLAALEATWVIAPATVPASTAPDERPDSLPETDFPRWVNLPGAAQLAWSQGSDEDALEGIETREYRCILFVAPVGDGISGEAIDEVRPYFAAGRKLFMAHQSLGGLNGVQAVRVIGDGGMAEMPYAKEPYWAILFRVQVQVRVRDEYASQE
jgi:hypothetical protein